MMFSIGYQGMKDPQELLDVLQKHDVQVVLDVRSKPYGRLHLFNKKALTAFLKAKSDIAYFWRGDKLGGFGPDPIAEADIAALAEWQKGKMVCLMCMEKNPDKCHRKYEIGKRLEPLGVEVVHLPVAAPHDGDFQQPLF